MFRVRADPTTLKVYRPWSRALGWLAMSAWNTLCVVKAVPPGWWSIALSAVAAVLFACALHSLMPARLEIEHGVLRVRPPPLRGRVSEILLADIADVEVGARSTGDDEHPEWRLELRLMSGAQVVLPLPLSTFSIHRKNSNTILLDGSPRRADVERLREALLARIDEGRRATSGYRATGVERLSEHDELDEKEPVTHLTQKM